MRSAKPHSVNKLMVISNCPTTTIFDHSKNLITPESSTQDPNDFIATLSEMTVRAFDQLAPLKKSHVSHRRKRWVTSSLRSLMLKRDRFYKIARQSGLESDYEKYRHLRRLISNTLDTAKNSYFSAKIKDAPTQKDRWLTLKRMGISSKVRPSPFTTFSPTEIITYFSSINGNRRPLSPIDLSKALETTQTHPNISFHFQLVTECDVLTMIGKSSSKAIGPDGLTSAMLQLATPSLRKPLTAYFNYVLSHSIFPQYWKRTYICPLAKTSKITDISDLRPIAKLSEPSKILGRVVHKQFSDYLNKYSFIDSRQASFRCGHSTQTALLGVLNDVRIAIDKRQLTLLVLFDFSKAFDMVPHDGLLRKLRKLGCADRSLKWFYNYLINRSQAVVDFNGNTSEWLASTSGVPQGSVLGPLLFTTFINDLPSVLSSCKHMIFADDTQIYYSFPPDEFDYALDLVNQDVQAVVDWSFNNGLSLNAKKTKVMLLGSEPFLSRFNLVNTPKIKIGDQEIPYENEVKSLGVIITPTLHWGKHVNLIIKRTYTTLSSLRFHRHALSREMKKSLIESLIFPHFDYAAAVYHDLDSSQNLRLHRTLNACVRFVMGNLPQRAHITPLRIKLGWLSVHRRREYILGSLAFSTIVYNNPEYLARRFTKSSDNLAIRMSNRLHPRCLLYSTPRTVVMSNSFTIVASQLLNTLTLPTFSYDEIHPFRIALWNKLLVSDEDDWNVRIRVEGIDI